ncbi:hypothetical protein Tco_0853306 [Tanacetum coccineum]
MSSITAQQTKLDLMLIPKEKRFDIGKCNGRIPHGFSPREPTIQVTLDICPTVQDQDFDALPTKEDNVSFLRDLVILGISLHSMMLLSIRCINLGELLLLLLTDDYQERLLIYGVVLPECLTSLEMKESKPYKNYLGHAIGVVPPKIARKFKKAFPTKKGSYLVPVDEEPVTKGKRVKRSIKKSSTKPATGIELLSEVALTKKAQLKEVRKKSLRDFYKTHPSGFGTIAEKPPSVEKITPTVTSEGTGDEPGVPDMIEDESTESKSESWGNDEDGSNNEQEASNEGINQENESEDDEIESDEDKGMDDTTDQFDDDVDASLEEPTQTGKEIVQGEGADKTEVLATSSSRSSDLASKFLNFPDIPHTDAEIVSPFNVPVQHEVPNTQTTTLLPIPVFVITTIPQSLQTFTPPPLVLTPTPPPITEATNPLTTLPDFASVFRFNDRITALEKEVFEIKKDPLHTQVTSLVDEHLDTGLGETKEEFMNFRSESLTSRIKEQVKDQLPQILPKEVSNFAPPVIKKLIKELCDELKKILLDKMEKSESYLTAPEHRDCYDGLKKSYALDKDFFYSYDVYSLKCGRKDKDKDEDPSAGSD